MQPEGVTFAGVAPVGDLTLIIPSILSADGVYGEGAIVQGQCHPPGEEETLAFEEPV